MDPSGDGEGTVTVPIAGGGEIRRSARRRLVQATLFPHKPREPEPEPERKNEARECSGVEEQGNGGGDEEGEEEEEGMCGSQSKKRRGRKGKSTPPANASNKEKSPLKRTPKKKNLAVCDGQGAADSVEIGESTPSSVPNLRLEAKLTAEENLRRFAGKQIHPFFTSLKVGKRGQEATELQNGCCSVQGMGKSATIGPVHVFESDQDDAMTVDWKDWISVEKNSVIDCCVEEGPILPSLGGLIEAIDNDRASGTPCTYDEPLTVVAATSPLSSPKFIHETSVTVPEIPKDFPAACHHHIEEAEKEFEIVEVSLSDGDTIKPGAEQQSECFQERIMSHNAACSNQPDKILWTDKYQPRKAMDVCGNNESVKFLNEWLQHWHLRGHQSNIDLSVPDEHDIQDADYDALQSACDSEDTDEENSCKNVLLITGPVGSGKSAAIHACAKEQGFKILEISASETRSGLVIKQKFGEALESQSLEWTHESLAGPECKDIVKFPEVLSSSKMTKELDDEVVEVTHVPDDDGLLGTDITAGKAACCDRSNVPIHNQIKPVVLFEDVDIVFPEDRGLTAAIQQIAETAKGPVILTSNNAQPVLPDNLHRLQVCFTMPSKEELLPHLHLVCASEKAKIQPVFLEQLIHNCQNDIRKTIMHLQFWCQGIQSRRGKKVPKLPAPMLFDPDAGHQILPKLMPWSFPSPFSELVEKEISAASLAMLRDASVSMDFSKQEENKEMDISEKDSIKAKKEAMLSRNCSEEEYNDFLTPSKSTSGYVSPSRTPDLSCMRKTRRKLNVVMSSDSEDEFLHDSFPSTSEKDNNHCLPLEVDCEVPLDCQGVHDYFNRSTSMHPCFRSNIFKEDISQCLEKATEVGLKDPTRSVDVSFVAESSFVPETEINGASAGFHSRMSFDDVNNGLEDLPTCEKFGQELLPIGSDNLCESTPTLMESDLPGTSFDLFVASLEEVEDSQNRHLEAATREFQLMDQCSRVDFNVEHVQVEQPRSPLSSHSVQESWRKLRDNHANLKHIVASEQKDAPGVIKLADEFSHLISEIELLLSKCQLLDFRNLSAVVSEESEVFSQSDNQLMMTSTIGQHGFCFYASEVASTRLKLGSNDEAAAVSFNRDTCTNKLMEVGGFAEHNALRISASNAKEQEKVTETRSETTLSRATKSHLFDIMHSLVPSRMCLTVRGDTFHEYLSSLSCISRSEAARLSGSACRTKRRGRTPRNYLSTGSLMLSPEEISLLCRCNLYGRSSFYEGDTDTR